MNKMANFKMAAVIAVVLFFPLVVFAANEEALTIHYPSVIAHAKANGNFSMSSGYNGDIVINAGPNNTGSVYFEGDDLKYIFEMIFSQPPYWEEHSPFGYLGEFHGGQKINIQLRAVDPEGKDVVYSLVAGALPPGISLDSVTGRVKGLVPDADTTYSFTIRATDKHGKYADNVFKLVARGNNFCLTNPCRSEGVCQDQIGDFHCSCNHPYGGKRCELNCQSHGLGVDYRYKVVPDGRMSGYNTYSSYYAYNGRINGGSGWYGFNETSWLQIDLGNLTQVYGIQMQACNSHYYTYRFSLQYSIDGNNFIGYSTSGSNNDLIGTTSTSTHTTILKQVITARYVRILPMSWYNSYRPCMKVELLGCYNV